MVQMETLVRIATIGGFTITGVGYWMFGILADRVRDSAYYIKAMELLRDHPGANRMLGSPIKDKRISLRDDGNNVCDGKNANFKVPVAGPISAGYYYFWATRDENEWYVTRAELEEKSDKTKRLVILKDLSLNGEYYNQSLAK